MLKTRFESETWLVQQPDHARVSGYLAAHWGNEQFAQPGHFASSVSSDLYREHVIHAIAEHDNGWWEWEANPEFDPDDHMPLNLPDVARTSRDAGLNRWRMGVPRLREHYPYASLLISMHAFWLYAFAFDDLPDLKQEMRHPMFGGDDTTRQFVRTPELTRRFLDEQIQVQREITDQLRDDVVFSKAILPEHLLPHVKLLQLMDAISLAISYGAKVPFTFTEIPRKNWEDRITLNWIPVSKNRIVCEPFPFDLDPLEVYLPVRVIDAANATEMKSPLVELHKTAVKTIEFQLCSG